jgi:ectoine hydroxylase-related dioxygenase (phytanoyl-CoA dioxygenase family)
LTALPTAAQHFERDGFLVTTPLLDDGEIKAISSALDALSLDSVGTRSMLSLAWCAELARQLKAHPVLKPLLPADAVASQCTLFEKSAGQKWLVPFHQDLGIPVVARIDHPELAGWSVKEDIVHVQPPARLLQMLVAVRLQVDHCTAQDGPLRVLPGSHNYERLSSSATNDLRASTEQITCNVERGAALLMRPLLLHASSKGCGTSRRRVLHFLFGPRHLPFGLNWNYAI